jgi:hypothetical protein
LIGNKKKIHDDISTPSANTNHGFLNFCFILLFYQLVISLTPFFFESLRDRG